MGVGGRVEGAGRGGCVTLVWVLPGHRGGRRAEQGRRRRRTAGETPPFPRLALLLHSFHRPTWPLPAHFARLKSKAPSLIFLISIFHLTDQNRHVVVECQQSSACPQSARSAPDLFCAPDRGKEKL